MPKPFSISLSISVLPSIRRDKSFKSSSRPARLILAVLGGFVLMGLWLFVIARVQSSAQAAPTFQPCNAGPAVIAGTHSSTGTSHNGVITAASDPVCIKTDLRVAKTVNTATPQVGEAITYTVTVTNGGPDGATGVQLTDVLPETVTFSSATPQNVCTKENNTITCDLGHLPNDDSAIVTIVVTPTQAGTITNIANVTGNETDSDPSNNTVEETAKVIGADLVVTKTVDITAPKAGDSITYTITAANNGPDNATGVQVVDVLPAGVSFGGYAVTRGTYITATGLWNVGDLANAASATMTIAATVISCTGYPTIPNTASISAAWPNDPNPENNESRAVITPTSGVYCLYLPIIFKNYEPLICNPYDFNDSPDDWPIDNEGKVRTGYTENKEEYYIQRGIPGIRIVQAPLDYSNQYTVEVDVHWGDIGYEYGLIFGQGSNADTLTYRFGVDPADRRYRLRYGSTDGGWGCVGQSSDPDCWVAFNSTTIVHSGYDPNRLRVECNRSVISLYINPKENSIALWQSNEYSCRGQVGVFAQSSPQDPNALAYFDNFRVSCPHNVAALHNTNGVPQVPTTFVDSVFDK